MTEIEQCPTMFQYNQCGGYKGHPGPCQDINLQKSIPKEEK